MTRIGGYNWVGTFKINGTCDATACCCPDTSLTFTNTGTALASSFRSQGLCKTAQHDISPNATQYELINVDHGTFTLTNNDTIMVVTLVQVLISSIYHLSCAFYDRRKHSIPIWFEQT